VSDEPAVDASTDFLALSVREFLHAAGSAAPTPGGGSVAAVTGAAAAALVAMVARLTDGRREYEDSWQRAAEVRQSADDLSTVLQAAALEDAAAFSAFMATLRLPRQTPAEREARAEAKRAATQRAIRAPLEVARSGLAVLKLAAALAPLANRNAVSDVVAAAHLARAAIGAAATTVEINVASAGPGESSTVMDENLTETREIDSLSNDILRSIETFVDKAIQKRSENST
jgi:formiminotetrahydrofolate cyclodeaminase